MIAGCRSEGRQPVPYLGRRIRAKAKKATDGDRIAIDSAVGICGWLLVVEALLVLERRGVL